MVTPTAVDKKDKHRTFCVDFDDLADTTAHTLDTLLALRERYPSFTCTLFAIPARCSLATIARFKVHYDWLKLAPHGYFHTRGECIGWTKQEAVDKIMAAKEMGIDAPVFKAPAWLLDDDIYDACAELGYVLATHRDHRLSHEQRPTGVQVKEYVYNDPSLRLKWTRPVHGHLSNVAGNYIVDMFNNGALAFNTSPRFINVEDAYVLN